MGQGLLRLLSLLKNFPELSSSCFRFSGTCKGHSLASLQRKWIKVREVCFLDWEQRKGGISQCLVHRRKGYGCPECLSLQNTRK